MKYMYTGNKPKSFDGQKKIFKGEVIESEIPIVLSGFERVDDNATVEKPRKKKHDGGIA